MMMYVMTSIVTIVSMYHIDKTISIKFGLRIENQFRHKIFVNMLYHEEIYHNVFKQVLYVIYEVRHLGRLFSEIDALGK